MMPPNMLPKIKIEIPNGEIMAERIFYLIKQVDASIANRFVFDIQMPLVNEIKGAKDFEEIKEKLIVFVSEHLDKDLPEKVKTLQIKWDEKNDLYFEKLETFFGEKMKKDLFIGYATNLMVGNYGNKEDFVLRYRDNNLDQAIYIIMEEVLHLIYWDFWRQTFNSEEKNPRLSKKEEGNLLSNWEISELIPEYAFYANKSSGREMSYPWVIPIRKIIDPIWKESTNFRDFLIKLHSLK